MRDDMGDTTAALALLAAGAFAAAGAVAMRVRPGNPTGAWMLALAWVVSLGEGAWEAELPWRFTIGMTVEGTVTALVAFLALAFPDGRLRGPWVRSLCLALAAVSASLVLARALWMPPTALCLSCPPAGNVLYAGTAPVDLGLVLDRLAIGFAVLVALVMVTLLARWLRASRPARRVLGPVLLTTVLLTAKVTFDLLVLGPELVGESVSEVRSSIVHPNQLLTALIPLTFLLAVVRSEFGRSPLARLLVDVVGDRAPVRVDRALAAALGDPSLRVGYRAAGEAAFVDLDGRPLPLPDPASGRRATLVGEPRDPLTVIVHDAALIDDERQLQAAAAAAGMTLRRERLRTELRLRLQQLSASRERLVHAVDDQRLRMEDELERGVEHRLAELAEGLDRLRRCVDDPPALAALDDVTAELQRTRGDLRAFVRDVRPAVIASDGVAAALDELARSARLQVAISCPIERRLPAAVESAIWFVCSESIVNVTKYARASRAQVHVQLSGAAVTVRVVDDGVGGAHEGGGSGLRGLRERVEALGGTFAVASPRGGGTTVLAELPLAESSPT